MYAGENTDIHVVQGVGIYQGRKHFIVWESHAIVFSTNYWCAKSNYRIGLAFRESFLHEMLTSHWSTKYISLPHAFNPHETLVYMRTCVCVCVCVFVFRCSWYSGEDDWPRTLQAPVSGVCRVGKGVCGWYMYIYHTHVLKCVLLMIAELDAV